MPVWSRASAPITADFSTVLTCSPALSTPLPRYRFLSPSRSSTASRVPVEAPDGTAARPIAPESRMTSASTVGLPRESMISRPRMSAIRAMALHFLLNYRGGRKILDESPRGHRASIEKFEDEQPSAISPRELQQRLFERLGLD